MACSKKNHLPASRTNVLIFFHRRTFLFDHHQIKWSDPFFSPGQIRPVSTRVRNSDSFYKIFLRAIPFFNVFFLYIFSQSGFWFQRWNSGQASFSSKMNIHIFILCVQEVVNSIYIMSYYINWINYLLDTRQYKMDKAYRYIYFESYCYFHSTLCPRSVFTHFMS